MYSSRVRNMRCRRDNGFGRKFRRRSKILPNTPLFAELAPIGFQEIARGPDIAVIPAS